MNMSRTTRLVALSLSVCAALQLPALAQKDDVFTVKPYPQLGNHSQLCPEESLELSWFARGDQDKWMVMYGTSPSLKRKATPTLSVVEHSVPEKVYAFHVGMDRLTPGVECFYTVFKNGKEVYSGKVMTRKRIGQDFRFAAFGDMGANTAGQKKVACQVYDKNPDFIVFLGDIVYTRGLLTEYYEKFFPQYSASPASAENGAPIFNSSLCFGVVGNHDIALGDNIAGIDLTKFGDDGLAFYKIWSEPLNGPLTDWRKSPFVPKLLGSEEKINQYLETVGNKYPRMANYSFDYGDSHWLVLDANHYMDWSDPELRDWVEKDLSAAKNAKWKFVCFHQPGFSFDSAHFKEQRMRVLSDVFEKNGVDVVLAGHAHDYQRSFPLKFSAKRDVLDRPVQNSDGTVDGAFTFDKDYDGAKDAKPKGVIYIVTGAGGAPLYGSIKAKIPNMQQEFTDKFISNTHSFTLCDVKGDQLTVKQISEDGNLIDEFKIDKGNGGSK